MATPSPESSHKTPPSPQPSRIHARVDVLIPTCERPAALAVTLAGLASQTLDHFRVVVSDQSLDGNPLEAGEVQAVARILRARGCSVELHRHLPRRGMAEQRQFLLDQCTAPYALFVDDDVYLEPDLIERLLRAIQEEGCGFVGSAVTGLSHLDDERPHEQAIEFWEGPVSPERVTPDSPAWERHKLHNAANMCHVARRLGLTPDRQRKYRVAWIGACVLYDVERLRGVGGFGFWPELPESHSGEDVLVQLRVMAAYGGCGVLPSGAHHLQVPTTVNDRAVDAPHALPLEPEPQTPRVSVLMPTFNRAAFIRRALDSLRHQSLPDWEAVIIDDGSRDGTDALIVPYLADPRIRYHRVGSNEGLGAALNRGLALARAPLVAYLPSDDVYHAEHLRSLAEALEARPEAIAAFSGVRHSYNRCASGAIEGSWLQLVQVMHRRVPERWTPRQELVTDDLGRMFWDRLEAHGAFVSTGQVTCEWVAHPLQRHRIVQEPEGGLNRYRDFYRVSHPMRFHSTRGNPIDEVDFFRRFRERPDTPRASDGLKILLVGELAYNSERILALEERGHSLYGLWMPDPYWYNSTGPLPFGHVLDLPREQWREALRALRPDVIYALLNWQAVPFAHQVLSENTGIPFVWHFKEGPFICLEKGTWDLLLDLYTRSDGQIYCSPEMREWLRTLAPDTIDRGPSLVLDGDLPKQDWFTDERSPRLGEQDDEIHTVVPGRPIGLHPETVLELAGQRVHLHFYGDFTHGQWRAWIERSKRLAGRYLHLHGNVDASRWVEEFSRYDAGWLHFFASANHGDIRNANWDDLNYPARIGTLVAAGLPMLQRANPGHIVATQSLVREQGLGIFFEDMVDAAEQLKDTVRMQQVRDHVWSRRHAFTFDHRADELVAFFRKVIENAPSARRLDGRRPHGLEQPPLSSVAVPTSR